MPNSGNKSSPLPAPPHFYRLHAQKKMLIYRCGTGGDRIFMHVFSGALFKVAHVQEEHTSAQLFP